MSRIRHFHLAIACLITGFAGAGEPLITDVRLHTPGGTFAPACQWSGEFPTLFDGKLGLAVNGSEVVARDLTSSVVRWRARDPDGRGLRPLLVTDHHLLLSARPRWDPESRTWDFTGCGDVRRLALAGGAWEAPLPSTAPRDHLYASAAIAVPGHLLISRQVWGLDQEKHDLCIALEVSAVGPAGNDWVRRWDVMEPIADPGAELFTREQPTTTAEDPLPCTPCGDLALICPGPTSPIHAVALSDGTNRWNLDRLWEFDRDFVGPSMWGHAMRRFGRDADWAAYERSGLDTMKTPEEQAAVAALVPGVIADWRKDFAAHCAGWIAGGPWLVPRHGRSSGKSRQNAILFAVALAPPVRFSRNLARLRIYELSEQGAVLGQVDLPRTIRCAQTTALPDSLVFLGDPCGIGAVRPTSGEAHLQMGGNNPDCLLTLAWYREPGDRPATAWLQGAWRPDPTVGGGLAIAPLDGGVIADEADTLLSTRFACTTLATGAEEEWRLDIPMNGMASLPATNYRGSPDGGMLSLDLPVPQASLTSLQFFDGRLVVTLGTADRATSAIQVVVFDLSKPAAPRRR